MLQTLGSTLLVTGLIGVTLVGWYSALCLCGRIMSGKSQDLALDSTALFSVVMTAIGLGLVTVGWIGLLQ